MNPYVAISIGLTVIGTFYLIALGRTIHTLAHDIPYKDWPDKALWLKAEWIKRGWTNNYYGRSQVESISFFLATLAMLTFAWGWPFIIPLSILAAILYAFSLPFGTHIKRKVEKGKAAKAAEVDLAAENAALQAALIRAQRELDAIPKEY